MTWAAIMLPDNRYRLYGHFNETSDIISSVVSSDGVSWAEESVIHISDQNIDANLELQLRTDVGVATLPEGGYLMAYLAVIP
tara:strand:+ start:323 stop:568 length:246 start_codon:yes stop_codon:yes gene_type:complete